MITEHLIWVLSNLTLLCNYKNKLLTGALSSTWHMTLVLPDQDCGVDYSLPPTSSRPALVVDTGDSERVLSCDERWKADMILCGR